MAEVDETVPVEEREPAAPDAEPEAPETPAPDTGPEGDPEPAPDTETPGEGEPESPDAPPVGPSQEEIEAKYKQLEKVRQYVARKVGEIMGDDAVNVTECPVCTDLVPGWIWHPSIAPLADETKAALYHLLGAHAPGDYKAHDAFKKCDACNGLGQVSTGSQRPGYETVGCPTCNELGYTQNLAAQIQPPNGAAAAPAPIVTGPTAIPDELTPEARAAQEQGYVVFKTPSLAAG